MNYRDPKFPKKLFFVGATFFTLGLIGFVAMLLKRILAGQGHYHYFDSFGYQFSYSGTLWVVGLFLLLLLGIVFLNKKSDKDELDFIRHMERNRRKR